MATRRELILGAAAALVVGPLAACRHTDADALPPGAIRVPLSELPDGQHVRRLRVDEPIELIRSGSTVEARSLFCTHFGCTLAWNGATERYDCPCHGGAFDEKGRPVGGPPIDPMRRLPVKVEREVVIVFPRQT